MKRARVTRTQCTGLIFCSVCACVCVRSAIDCLPNEHFPFNHNENGECCCSAALKHCDEREEQFSAKFINFFFLFIFGICLLLTTWNNTNICISCANVQTVAIIWFRKFKIQFVTLSLRNVIEISGWIDCAIITVITNIAVNYKDTMPINKIHKVFWRLWPEKWNSPQLLSCWSLAWPVSMRKPTIRFGEMSPTHDCFIPKESLLFHPQYFPPPVEWLIVR